MRFFKYGVHVFDSSAKEHGGFNHFIAGKIFRWRLSYLSIHLRKECKFELIHNNDEYYYDGYHNILCILFIHVFYGT